MLKKIKENLSSKKFLAMLLAVNLAIVLNQAGVSDTVVLYIVSACLGYAGIEGAVDLVAVLKAVKKEKL